MFGTCVQGPFEGFEAIWNVAIIIELRVESRAQEDWIKEWDGKEWKGNFSKPEMAFSVSYLTEAAIDYTAWTRKRLWWARGECELAQLTSTYAALCVEIGYQIEVGFWLDIRHPAASGSPWQKRWWKRMFRKGIILFVTSLTIDVFSKPCLIVMTIFYFHRHRQWRFRLKIVTILHRHWLVSEKFRYFVNSTNSE